MTSVLVSLAPLGLFTNREKQAIICRSTNTQLQIAFFADTTSSWVQIRSTKDGLRRKEAIPAFSGKRTQPRLFVGTILLQSLQLLAWMIN
jgi:hypothetical protein